MVKVNFFDLIKNTINSRKEIIEEHKIFMDYQRKNPEIIYELTEQLKNSNVEVPNFETIISLKQDYLIDNISKIYRQIIKKNPLLINYPQGTVIFYYALEPDLFKKQIEKGYIKGEYDEDNYLVTGSNLVLKQLLVNVDSFIRFYSELCN